jgi:hypothetical protein
MMKRKADLSIALAGCDFIEKPSVETRGERRE